MPISLSSLAGGGAASSTTKTYLGGTGTFTLNLPAGAYDVTAHTALTLDGTELSANANTKVFGSITKLKSAFGPTDFSSDTEISPSIGGVYVRSTATNGSRLVIATSSTTPMFYSDDDGATWTVGSNQPSGTYHNVLTVVWDPIGERFLASGSYNNSQWVWIQSADGATWSPLSKAGSYTTNTYGNEKMWTFSNGYTVAMATDYIDVLAPGSNSVTRYYNSSYRVDGASANYADNTIYMVNGNSSSYYYVIDVSSISNSLSSPKQVNNSGTGMDGVGANGDTIVVLYSSQYITSTDGGATWGPISSIPGIANSHSGNCNFVNGSFVIYGYNGSNNYVFTTSTDGLTWTSSNGPEYNGLRDINFDNGKLYVTWANRTNFNVLAASQTALQATIETLGELVAPDA